MSKTFAAFDADHLDFIAAQAVFFVATSAPGAHHNLSPKGMDSLRIIGPNHLLWVNATGSGNETAAHLRCDPRMTILWCGFGARPLILRAYGKAVAHHRSSPQWTALAPQLPDLPGTRQIIEMTVDLVQTSCGFAVPVFDAPQERPVLRDWATAQGPEGLRSYWSNRNRTSVDGIPTGIEANLDDL